jgi:CHAD domain-containing protein
MIDGDPNGLSGRTTSNERFGRPPRRPAVPEPLLRRSEEMVRLLKELSDDPKPRAVHQLRTTIRRLETLLPDPEHAGSPERKILKQLDRVRRRAGKVRDVDVHLKALWTLPRRLGVEAREELRADLCKARQKRLKRLTRRVGDERDRGLVKRLRQVTRTALGAGGAVDPEHALLQVLDDFAAARRAAEPLGAANLHAFRIATKRLRYRAEVIASIPEAAAAVVEMKRLQDAIGAWHDWLTLGERAEKTLGKRLGKIGTPLVEAVRARTVVQLTKAVQTTERVARRLAKLRPSRLRKGVRPVTAPVPGVPRQSAGAPA